MRTKDAIEQNATFSDDEDILFTTTTNYKNTFPRDEVQCLKDEKD